MARTREEEEMCQKESLPTTILRRRISFLPHKPNKRGGTSRDFSIYKKKKKQDWSLISWLYICLELFIRLTPTRARKMEWKEDVAKKRMAAKQPTLLYLNSKNLWIFVCQTMLQKVARLELSCWCATQELSPPWDGMPAERYHWWS